LANQYIYADAQILCQYVGHDDPNVTDQTYYYVHDRLGSVRLVVDCNMIDETVTARNDYTYSPFGNPYPGTVTETIHNPFQFTGQWFDSEINQYYLRARMYDPTMMRFMTRDPVRGEQNEPLTLHTYLYCLDNPVNRIDITGESANGIVGSILAGAAVYAEGINTASYAAHTDNWEFFDLSFDILQYGVPGAMSLGATGFIPSSAANFCLGAFWTATVGRFVDYHMNPISPMLIPWQSTIWFYSVVTWSVNRHEVSGEDIDDFNSWMYPEWMNEVLY